MQTFLESIACAYAGRYEDLSEFCFVFPNKRSGSFFLRHLQNMWETPHMTPEVTTITDVATELSGLLPDSRIDLLFRLFECYKEVIGRHVRKQGDEEVEVSVDFDRFRMWGETVLNDFNEVDIQLVDADEIFKNVKDFKEISSTFVTEEQKQVMEEYFGYTGLWDGEERFWREFESIGDIEEETASDVVDQCGGQASGEEDSDKRRESRPHRNAQKKFLHLWRLLKPLYKLFNTRLEKDGMATPGGCYRRATERLDRGEQIAYVGERKFVFIGFNALTHSERSIMQALAEREIVTEHGKEPGADFYWDMSGPLLEGDNIPAARFVKSNRRLMPEPGWAESFLCQSKVRELPEEIRVIAVPSSTQQLKIISRLITDSLRPDSLRPIKGSDVENARVAVVLPDEQMLLPMLSSMPEGVEAINLTMGYPLRQTPVVSFLNLLRRMQLRQRTVRGVSAFCYADMAMLLSHPFAQAIFGSSAIGKFQAVSRRHKRLTVCEESLEELRKRNQELLRTLPRNADAVEVLAYIGDALESADHALASVDGMLLKHRIEHQHIARCQSALAQLGDCLARYSPQMSRESVFSLADRLIAGETVAFEGEPLQGLQIMGMLETRSLDFDYLFIPNVEDKRLPKRGRSRTFIPNAIRRGYGMPPANYQEEMFAYYFFRLIGRSRRVVLTYDSRAGNSRSGGISRYILQLRHLFAKGRLLEEEALFRLARREDQTGYVVKNEAVREKLAAYFAEGERDGMSPKYLSASAVSTYCNCPLQFYYRYVAGRPDNVEPTETISPTEHGDVVHNTLLDLYLPDVAEQKRLLDTPKVITKQYIESILDDEERVNRLVCRWINRLHFNLRDESEWDAELTGSPAIVAPQIATQVKAVLKKDRDQTPFTLYGCEIKERLRYDAGDGMVVNMTMAIDRLDSVTKTEKARKGKAPEERTVIRIIDYKTGSVHLKATNPEDVFSGAYESKNILQLQFYAEMLEQLGREGRAPMLPYPPEQGVEVRIYNVPKILDSSAWSRSVPNVSSLADKGCEEKAAIFREGLGRVLKEIFDHERPFGPTCDRKRCALCGYYTLCRCLHTDQQIDDVQKQ